MMAMPGPAAALATTIPHRARVVADAALGRILGGPSRSRRLGAWRRGLAAFAQPHRHDWRAQWRRCIDTLAAAGAEPVPERAIRVLAEAVDSPAGLLFLREPGQPGLAWAGAWNTGPAAPLPETGKLAAWLRLPCPPVLSAGTLLDAGMLALADPWHDGPPFQAWLAVAVPNSDPGAPPLGCMLLGRPRLGRSRLGSFRLGRFRARPDAETLELLGMLANEVGVHLARQRAVAALRQSHDLRACGERFAFVAHDIKTVSAQLALLLANAETHLAKPDFQTDMLATLRASVARIGFLLGRLRDPASLDPASLNPAASLAALLAARQPDRTAVTLAVDPAARATAIAMGDAAFAAAVTHLLDNATAACGPGGSVRVALRAGPGRAVLDIADDGPGMTPEFIRDELFRPLATRTAGGSGLGAFQSRELLRAAGADLVVLSRPAPGAGRGTTMRLSWPLAPAVPVGSPVAVRLAA